MRDLSGYAHFWTTERHQFVLVPLVFPGGETYYDVYHRDGTYQYFPEPDVGTEVAGRMAAAGVEVMEPDEWIHFRQVMEYEPYWTTRKQDFILECFGDPSAGGVFNLFENNGRWHQIYLPQVRDEVLRRMYVAGVECLSPEQWAPRYAALQEQARECQFQSYAPLWTTELREHLLVAYQWEDGTPYMHLVRKDGHEYRLCCDELAARIKRQMLAAGVEVIDSETWESTLREIYTALATSQYDVG
jgi:hypothetical protein